MISRAIIILLAYGPIFVWPLVAMGARGMIRSGKAVAGGTGRGWGALVGLSACAVLFAWMARAWAIWFRPGFRGGFGLGYTPADIAIERVVFTAGAAYAALGVALLLPSTIKRSGAPAVRLRPSTVAIVSILTLLLVAGIVYLPGEG